MNDLIDPNIFNSGPDAAFASLNTHEDSLADGISQGYGILGYKGGKWTIRLRGETYHFKRPDDGTQLSYLDVIILRSAPYRSRSWYKQYEEGVVGQRPLCASTDGLVPDDDVVDRQAQACAVCPRNAFKYNDQGRKTKDCRDYKRLSVLILPHISKAALGEPHLLPVFLRVPAASLASLSDLASGLEQREFHYSAVVTRISFDPQAAYPKMIFRAVQKLTKQEAPLVLELREDALSYRITGEDQLGKGARSTVLPRQGMAPSVSAPIDEPAPLSGFGDIRSHETGNGAHATSSVRVEPKTVEVEDEVAALERQLAKMKAAKAAANGGGTERLPPIDFGGLDRPAPVVEASPVVKATAAVQAKTISEADIGPADDSDADLDARVASLFPRK